MRRSFVCLFAACLIAGSATLGLVFAQAPQTETLYTVQDGDNLWDLAGAKLEDPRLWRQIYDDNPFLQEPGRLFRKNGRIIVLLRPGEKLIGLEKLGVTPTPIPVEKLGLPTPPPVVVRDRSTWPYWLLGVLGLFALGLVLMRRMLDADPVRSRPAIASGGITPENSGEFFQRQAARLNQQRTGVYLPNLQNFTVLEQTAGRIWGVLNVRYADGREVPRRLNGERAYRARVRFPNNTEETLYMLQGCGNDLRYGGISRYLPGPEFRFEADQPVTPVAPQPAATPEPEPVPATVAVANPPANPAPAEAVEDGTVSLEFRTATENEPQDMVRLQGVEVNDFTFTQRGAALTVRFRPVRPRRRINR